MTQYYTQPNTNTDKHTYIHTSKYIPVGSYKIYIYLYRFYILPCFLLVLYVYHQVFMVWVCDGIISLFYILILFFLLFLSCYLLSVAAIYIIISMTQNKSMLYISIYIVFARVKLLYIYILIKYILILYIILRVSQSYFYLFCR